MGFLKRWFGREEYVCEVRECGKPATKGGSFFMMYEMVAWHVCDEHWFENYPFGLCDHGKRANDWCGECDDPGTHQSDIDFYNKPWRKTESSQ